MKHDLKFLEEQVEQVVFKCAGACGAAIGFPKPGFGDPAAVQDGGNWAPPENAGQWMGKCEAPVDAP